MLKILSDEEIESLYKIHRKDTARAIEKAVVEKLRGNSESVIENMESWTLDRERFARSVVCKLFDEKAVG